MGVLLDETGASLTTEDGAALLLEGTSAPVTVISGLLDQLNAALVGQDTQPMQRRHIALVVQIIQLLVQQADSRLDAVEGNVATLQTGGAALQAQVQALQGVPAITMTVVATPAGLPATAPPTSFFRVQGDTSLYIGNGPANPLGRITSA